MQETASGFIYRPEDETAARGAIESHFGPIARVLRETGSSDLRVDLCVIEPGPGRPFLTVVTCGMGARDMPTPPELREFARAELLFLLPPGWDIHGGSESSNWPLSWLKLLAHLPWDENSWLGWGHTIPNGEPFADHTELSALLLLDPYLTAGRQAQTACLFRLPDDNIPPVHFYQCFALYEEELREQLAHGTQALLERFSAQKLLTPVLDLARPNLFAAPKSANDRQIPLPHDWRGPTGCLVTDRILVDGAPVGYCYREAPFGDWDSGWRFTAGDESDEYMDDPRHSNMDHLNCIANYDADILPILTTPAPCAFSRSENGLRRLKNIR